MRVAILLAVLAMTACANRPTGDNLVFAVDVPDGMTIEQVGDVILETVVHRKWDVAERSDGFLHSRLIHREYDANLHFRFDANQVVVYSDSYEVKRSGERKKRKDPKGWIANIEKDLKVRLRRARYLEP